jgi:hypothetical protein
MPSASGSVRATSSGGCPAGHSKLARPASVYRQKWVDEGVDEAPVRWTESEAVQKAEHAWRRAAGALEAERPCLWPAMATPKVLVDDLAEQVHQQLGLVVPEHLVPPRFRAEAHRVGRVPWRHIRRAVQRQPVREVLALVLESLRGRDAILFAESLEVAPTQAAALHELAEHCQLAAAMDADNRRGRIMRLLWRFQRTVELPPLTRAETRELVERWLAERPVTFDGPKVRERFILAVCRNAPGVPADIAGMLEAATHDREVTRERLRDYQHEAAAVYWDMTPLLSIAVIAFMAMRYVSRGIGETELLVLSGVGSALFWGG